MGKSSGTQSTTVSPWAPSTPSLGYGLNEANRIYYGTNPTAPPPPGYGAPTQSYNPLSPYQTPILGPGQPTTRAPVMPMSGAMPFDPSTVPGYDLWAPAEAELMKTIEGGYLSEPNPYLEDTIRLAGADVTSMFEGQGRYGSGAHGQELFSSVAAPIRYADYERERQNQLMAIGALPSFQQGYAAAPYSNLNAYLGTVLPISGMGSTQSQDLYSNPLTGAAGGALAGYGIAGALGAPVTWPYLLGGALVGGLASG